jgi:hypothetical protein
MLKKIVKNLLGPEEDTRKLQSLYKQPRAEKKEDMAQFQVFKSNLIQQADLLFITNDRGYKYILVVVDDHSKKMDAEKLREKDSVHVAKAFRKIYDRNILKIPEQIELDDGKEFKGEVREFFDEHNTRIRYALPNRHRQQGLVERKNQILGTIIHRIQTYKELEKNNGKLNREWIKLLPNIVEQINEHLPKPLTDAVKDTPISNDYNKKLLPIGTHVRIQLDHPIGTNNKRLHGEFRSSDIRWTPKIYKVTQVLLVDGKPPMYLTDKSNEVAYTKEQLQKVSYHFV